MDYAGLAALVLRCNSKEIQTARVLRFTRNNRKSSPILGSRHFAMKQELSLRNREIEKHFVEQNPPMLMSP